MCILFPRIVRVSTLCFLAAAVGWPLAAAKITEFTIPNGGGSPHEIVTGPDGRLWFTEYYQGRIGAMTTAGVVEQFPIGDTSHPVGIAAVGKLRTLAFTAEGLGRIGVIVLDDLQNGGFSNPDFSRPNSIVAGPDGRIWFTQEDSDVYAFHWLTNSPAGAPFAPATDFGTLAGIAVGPDGHIWYTDRVTNKIGSCPPEGGACVDFTVPTGGSEPTRIAAGKDGALWFTERAANKIGRITTAGVITEFPVPTAGSQPFAITGGNDGNVWFTEVEGSKIGRITPAGVITEYTIPTPNSGPECITNGPDGNIWFGEFYVDKIGRLQVHISGDFDDSGARDVSDVFYLINFLFAGGPAPKG
jgi:streptogramin lyase